MCATASSPCTGAFCTRCTSRGFPRTSPLRSRRPASATCWVTTTPTATPRSMTPWSAWRRTFRCATCWSTGTATSVPWTATPRPPTDTPKRGFPKSPTRCCAISKRTPSTGTRTSTRAGRSPASCPHAFRTCSLTAPAASRSAWPRTSRPTTSPRSSTPASACWITPRRRWRT